MSKELAVPDNGYAMVLSVQRGPDEVLREAHEAAKALKGVIDAKPNKVMFGTETYLEYEDWQTVGRFYGIAPQIAWTRFLDLGEGVRGWEARADAIHVPTGRVVASAESMCLNDEEKWSARSKYEWAYVRKSGGHSVEDPGKDELVWEARRDGKGNAPKKEKILVGQVAVPMFQLRSMAQTRAGAKALRNALAWVVVLAGYKPTPAEEMPDYAAPQDAARPEVMVPKPSAATTNAIEPEVLFPHDHEVDERTKLVDDINRLMPKVCVNNKDRLDAFESYLGSRTAAAIGTSTLDKLTDLVNALRKRAGESPWSAAA